MVSDDGLFKNELLRNTHSALIGATPLTLGLGVALAGSSGVDGRSSILIFLGAGSPCELFSCSIEPFASSCDRLAASWGSILLQLHLGSWIGGIELFLKGEISWIGCYSTLPLSNMRLSYIGS